MGNQKPASIERTGDDAVTVEALRQEIAGGLLYCHHRANTNTGKTLEMTAFSYALVDLLIEKGLLTEEELNERKREMGERLVKKFQENGMGVEIQDSKIDKYEFKDGPRIDCENRIHACKAACCRLRFPLSPQDLEEGVVKWDLPHPYLIARGADGFCAHLGRGSCRCTIYQHRPLPCRSYDCRQDRRIWEDFDKKFVSPDLENLFQV